MASASSIAIELAHDFGPGDAPVQSASDLGLGILGSGENGRAIIPH